MIMTMRLSVVVVVGRRPSPNHFLFSNNKNRIATTRLMSSLTRTAATTTTMPWQRTQQHQQQQYTQRRRSHYTYSGPGSYPSSSWEMLMELWKTRDFHQRGFTVGIGGPVGSGKTATVHRLCQEFVKLNRMNNYNNIELGVVTNDIFTQEDAEFLQKQGVLPFHRILPIETGGCPHAAIREDISANLTALEQLTKSIHHEQLQSKQQQQQMQPCLLLCESGGDNLAANFSRELADLTIYVIDVAGGDKVPRKGGPGITQSDLLVINKIDLAKAVGANLNIMKHDAILMRGRGTSKRKSSSNRNSLHHNTTITHSHDHSHDHHHDHHAQKSASSDTLSSSSNAAAADDDDDEDDDDTGDIIFAAVKHGHGIPEITNFILKHYYQAISL